MTFRIQYRPAADAEFNDAAQWYEDQRPGLGVEFIDDVQAVIDLILEDPLRFPIALDDIREAMASRFPYCIYYRVKGSHIIVISVSHTSRDPAVWQSRN